MMLCINFCAWVLRREANLLILSASAPAKLDIQQRALENFASIAQKHGKHMTVKPLLCNIWVTRSCCCWFSSSLLW